MKSYPSIPTTIRADVPIHAFDKLDGSQIRAVWAPKPGFVNFGTRTRALESSHPWLGEAIALIRDKYEAGLTRALAARSGPGPEGDPVSLALRAQRTLAHDHPAVAPARIARLFRAYGADAATLLAEAPGAQVAPGLHESELAWLCQREWARDADDVLWRRSKLGLHYTPEQRAAVAAWFAGRATAPARSPLS
jgi:glycerol-3-phosphate dehydrogenase